MKEGRTRERTIAAITQRIGYCFDADCSEYWSSGGSTMVRRRLTDAEILAQIPAARARERRERKMGLRATSAKYDRAAHRVVLELTNGYSFAFPVRAVRALNGLTSSQLAEVELDPSGAALLWDSVDIDLSVPGILLSAVGVEERLRHLASLAGSTTSDAKAAAARSNGRKGGRPPKRARKVKVKR
jgi:hypothetical protein